MIDNNTYTRNDLETMIKPFLKVIQDYERHIKNIYGKRNHFINLSTSPEIEKAYNIFNCLKDFSSTKTFKPVYNNFYSFIPAQYVKNGNTSYS